MTAAISGWLLCYAVNTLLPVLKQGKVVISGKMVYTEKAIFTES